MLTGGAEDIGVSSGSLWSNPPGPLDSADPAGGKVMGGLGIQVSWTSPTDGMFQGENMSFSAWKRSLKATTTELGCSGFLSMDSYSPMPWVTLVYLYCLRGVIAGDSVCLYHLPSGADEVPRPCQS